MSYLLMTVYQPLPSSSHDSIYIHSLLLSCQATCLAGVQYTMPAQPVLSNGLLEATAAVKRFTVMSIITELHLDKKKQPECCGSIS